jgi:transposase
LGRLEAFAAKVKDGLHDADFQTCRDIIRALVKRVEIDYAQHIKAVPRRKTDTKDAEWIADLLQHGLLKASFIPSAPQRELRELTRYRVCLTEERTREINRVQKTLEGCNLK